MKFELVSPQGIQFEGAIYEVVVPTETGAIAVLQDHMPLITTVSGGVVSVRGRPSGPSTDFQINGGVLETDGAVARLLVDSVTTTIEEAHEQAQEAEARAGKLAREVKSRIKLGQAAQVLRRPADRLQVTKIKKRRHR